LHSPIFAARLISVSICASERDEMKKAAAHRLSAAVMISPNTFNPVGFEPLLIFFF
jgi:hypothetical protein